MTFGDRARLLPWPVEHHIVRATPNDPNAPPTIGAPPASGGLLSWTSQFGLGPIDSEFMTPGMQATQRIQTVVSLGSYNAAPSANTGGIYLGTIPMGSWIESVEAFLYAQWQTGGTLNGFGVYYAQAGAFSTANVLGLQPQQLYSLGSLSNAGNNNTLYSTETGTGKTAWTNAATGPGNAEANSAAGNLASLFDIDVYALVFTTAALTNGAMSVAINYTGPPTGFGG